MKKGCIVADLEGNVFLAKSSTELYTNVSHPYTLEESSILTVDLKEIKEFYVVINVEEFEYFVKETKEQAEELLQKLQTASEEHDYEYAIEHPYRLTKGEI